MNKAKESTVAVTFSVAKIYVSEFALNEDYVKYPIESLKMIMNHRISIGAGDDGDEARVTINAGFIEQKKNLDVFSMTCVSTFKIVNIKNYIVGKKFDLPETFLITIASLGYSHARAIMSQYAQGYFMLPMINPVEVFGASIREAKAKKQIRKSQKSSSK
jgi:hypothetical protein